MYNLTRLCRRRQRLHGEVLALDGNDMGVYSWHGQRRYELHFYDYVSTFQIVVYHSALDAPELRKAMEYAKETVLLLTNGTKVKQIWSGAFSTYLSASLASLRLSTGLNLNVFPPHAHSSNPVENCIGNSARSCRKNIANLVSSRSSAICFSRR